MKKLIIGMTLLTVVLLSSCKKSYTCECDTTSVQTTTSRMEEYEFYDGTVTEENTTETALDESSKTSAQANCLSSESTIKMETNDDEDADGDGNTTETAYSTVTDIEMDCTLSK